jgi:RNA polymerase II subunit A C-terminal domain phosphatase
LPQKGTVKVDMARRIGGIKIVYPAWLTDSIAYWRRQDETPYFLDDPPTSPVAGPSRSPTSPIKPLSLSLPVPPEMAEEGEHIWDLEEGESDLGTHGGGGADSGNLELGDVDWNDANAELEAFMNESDDGDEAGGEGMDDDGYDDDVNSVDRFVSVLNPSQSSANSGA